MISIVSLEIQKILKRKFILILLAIYSAILLFMAYAGHPDRYTPILTSDGKVLEGTEAVQYEKKLAENTTRFLMRMCREFWRRMQEFSQNTRMKIR